TGGGDEFAFVTEPTAIAASSGGAGKLDDELDVALMEWDSTAAVGSAETAAVSAAVAAPRLDDDLDSQLRSLDFAFDDELQNMAGDIGRPTSVATGAAADELPDNTLVLGQESAFPLQEEDTLTVELKDFDFGLDDQPPAPPVAEDQPAKSASPILVIEDPALGGDDHVETKLDLAQAYLDMEDKDGARSLLEEVLQEGDARQRQRAEELLRLVA
ncbi:MAG TPA: FimV/HubP family polar landmark protein, partial [Candidatus Competibacteraceae bacterium]|nr:FimV/HubP family polar landmark protein [Candidatus Competibacteraceae bacterium]